MQRILIPFFACLLFGLTGLRAQVPLEISITGFAPPAESSRSAMMTTCNNAGTVFVGPIIGQSNDATPDTVYLCFGDSLFIEHNGDFDLSGDPNPATPPGVGYAFYRNPPTIMGPHIDSILVFDTLNIFPGSMNGIYITAGTANGDTYFHNDGSLQAALSDNIGQATGSPLLIWFAPITIDALPTFFENGGGCVNVNTDEAFAVVYLNNIINTTPVDEGNCLMRFRISGGYPEFDEDATYNVSITRVGFPNIKGIIYTAQSQLKHSAVVYFSAPEPGLYEVVIEDGKSCGHTFQVNVTNCDPTASVQLQIPELIAPQGSSICVPVTVGNFNDMSGINFSLQWDDLILDYDSVTNINPIFEGFGSGNLNEILIFQGKLGILLRNEDNPTTPLTLADGDTLFEVCFTAIGPWESCSGITVINDPTQINASDTLGVQDLAIFVDTGQVCIDTLPLQVIVQTLPACSGNGSIQVTAIGGTPPYDVRIQNSAGGPVILIPIATDGGTAIRNNLPNGTYDVCLVDQNGINFDDSVCTSVTLNVQILGASIVGTEPSCFGFNDGSITATVTLGAIVIPNPNPLDYAFSWSGPSGPISDTSPVIINLLAGPYFLTITDLNTGCTAVASGTLSQPNPVVEDDRTVSPAACTGICDGQILFDARGGTPFPNGEYSYHWEFSSTPSGPSMPLGSIPDVVDSVSNPGPLCSGYYFLTVTDARGCTFSPSNEIEITNLRDLSVAVIELTEPSCAGLSDGSICVELTATPAFAAGANYNFFWSGCTGALIPVDSANTSCISNLITCNDYAVIAVETGTGCVATLDSIELSEPAPLILSALSVQNPTCIGLNDGAISVIATGGAGQLSYAFQWSCDTTFTGPNLTGLDAGTYCVTVIDANSCSDTAIFNLALPAPPAITGFNITAVNCGADGCLEVLAPTGTLFEWRNAANDSIISALDTVNKICNLPGGTYFVYVEDANGCSNTDTAALAPVVPLDITDTVYTEPTCFAGTNGSIGIVVSGGSPQYSFVWTDANGNAINGNALATSIGAGTYTILVTDSKACTITETYTLTQPPSIGAQQNNIVGVSCFGVCDGSIELQAFYNTVPPSQGSFSYTWPDASTGNIRNDLCAGSYNVTISDSTGCSRVETVIIGTPPAVSANITIVDATCFDGMNGRATAFGVGGNGGPYTYAWSTGPTGNTATGLEPGEVFVTITDNSGCTGVDTAFISSPDSIEITASATDVNCYAANDGTLSASATGGTPGYTYTWEDSDGNLAGTGDLVEDVLAGNYFVVVTDSLGCTNDFGPVTIIEPPAITGIIEPWTPLDCNGDVTTLVIDTVFGGWGGPYRYSVDGGQPTATDYEYFPLTGGEHIIAFFDVQGCFVTDTIEVIEPAPVTVTFDPIEIILDLGDSTQLSPILGGVTLNSIDTFFWSPIELLQPFSPDPLMPYVFTFESEYFTLSIIDTNGCTGSGTVYVKVDANRNVYVPNVFKPGADLNQNDRFLPVTGRGVSKINFMRVFDRWGSLVYENDNLPIPTNEFVDGWDGRVNGKFVTPDVFVYAIEVEFLDGRIILYRGDVTVVR